MLLVFFWKLSAEIWGNLWHTWCRAILRALETFEFSHFGGKDAFPTIIITIIITNLFTVGKNVVQNKLIYTNYLITIFIYKLYKNNFLPSSF